MRFFVLGLCFVLPVLAQQCSFSINPSSATFPAAGGNGTLAITATPTSCAWTTTSDTPVWLTVSFGQTGTGNGSAGYTVRPNTTAALRTGTLNVAGQIFTVTQQAANCTFNLTPSSATVPVGGGSGSFEVASACSWTATTTAGWVTLSGTSGTGAGNVGWTAAPNTTTQARTATIVVGTASFTITQPGVCQFTFTTSQVSFSSQGGSGTITIKASNSACERPVRSTVPWITILSGQTGTGDGSLQFTVDANNSATPRNGSILIADQSIAIGQFGSNCTYVLSPLQATVAVNGGVGTFTVTTTCSWSPTTSNSWISITSGTSSITGSGTVSYAVSANLDPTPRTGGISIGSTIFNISQPAASCDVTLEPSDLTLGSEGGIGLVRIMALPACSWSAASSVSWITVDNPKSGTGDGAIQFKVDANTTVRRREGAITIGNRVFRVTQGAATCSVTLGTRALTLPASGGTGSIAVTANCDWTATTNVGWIVFNGSTSGSGNGTVGFTVAANASSETRRGAITTAGQEVAITQSAPGCNGLTLSSSTVMAPARGGVVSIDVTGSPACSWSASSADAWAQVTWASVSGSGRVTVSVGPNTTGGERTSSIAIAGQTLRVVQPPITIRVTADGVVNAASFASGVVAPGEIVTIFGSGFGPTAIVGYQLTADRGAFTKALSDTRVLFDGVPAAMVYTSDGQLSAIVPYAVSGKGSTELVVEYLGARSNAVSIPVGATSPAIFTLDASGKGQGAVLNQNYSVNGAANPADRGSVIQIFATGEGSTNPAGVDGKLTVTPLPRPVAPVRVLIGGVEAVVQYAGGAPGLVAGLVQVNAVVPRDVVPGNQVPVVLDIGGKASASDVTIAVR